jgi:hypothetical protein
VLELGANLVYSGILMGYFGRLAGRERMGGKSAAECRELIDTPFYFMNWYMLSDLPEVILLLASLDQSSYLLQQYIISKPITTNAEIRANA